MTRTSRKNRWVRATIKFQTEGHVPQRRRRQVQEKAQIATNVTLAANFLASLLRASRASGPREVDDGPPRHISSRCGAWGWGIRPGSRRRRVGERPSVGNPDGLESPSTTSPRAIIASARARAPGRRARSVAPRGAPNDARGSRESNKAPARFACAATAKQPRPHPSGAVHQRCHHAKRASASSPKSRSARDAWSFSAAARSGPAARTCGTHRGRPARCKRSTTQGPPAAQPYQILGSLGLVVNVFVERGQPRARRLKETAKPRARPHPGCPP